MRKFKNGTYDTIFYAVILGVLMEEPTILDPELKIPLKDLNLDKQKYYGVLTCLLRGWKL